MQYKLIILTFFILSSCSGQIIEEKLIAEKVEEVGSIRAVAPESRPTSTDPTAFGIDTLPPSQSYTQTKTEIAAQRLLLAQAYQAGQITLDSIGHYFEQALLNQIIPYWYGTPWTFEGHTNIPNQGTIACGYFVSTTLKQMGLNLNRYKLAQQWPKHEAKSLDAAMMLVEGNCKELLSKMQEGIYFIGLDASHVGYLLKRQNQLFFIHSNYSTPVAVVIEDAAVSEVFQSYSQFYLAKVSTNKSLIKAWLAKDKIEIVLED